MVLFMALVLVIIWASIMAWVYWVINPFVAELWNIQRYNQAYYGAIAGVERAELVLRGHEAWFEWSGGRIDKTTYGNQSDYDKIVSKQNFGFLAFTGLWNWIFWQIKSMTNWIVPEPWKWNLDLYLSIDNDYEKLTFDRALQYALYRDISWKGDYYTGVKDKNIENINIPSELDVSIRVPFKLVCAYNSSDWKCNSLNRDSTWTLLGENNDEERWDLDWDGVNDDVVVNRSLFGYTGQNQFTIFPSINLNNDGTKPANNDTTIRESVISYYVDDNVNIKYDTSSTTNDAQSTNPVVWRKGSNTTTSVGGINKFNQSPDDAVDTGFDFVLNNNYWDTFANSQANWKIGKMNLKFSLVNLLKYDENHVYPYLEVKLIAKKNSADFIDNFPDLNFHIIGEGKVIDYDVKILISKPVFEATAASDFTVLF